MLFRCKDTFFRTNFVKKYIFENENEVQKHGDTGYLIVETIQTLCLRVLKERTPLFLIAVL